MNPTVTAAPTRAETYAPTRVTEAPSYAPTTETYCFLPQGGSGTDSCKRNGVYYEGFDDDCEVGLS